MKAFICSQFGYCPLVWMFHRRKISSCINNLNERTQRVVWRDYNATFSELKDKSVTIHQKKLTTTCNRNLLGKKLIKSKNYGRSHWDHRKTCCFCWCFIITGNRCWLICLNSLNYWKRTLVTIPCLCLYYVNVVSWFKLDCSTCRATCMEPI